MKYVVDRTSLWDDDTPPCEGAFTEKFERPDERTLQSEKAYDDKLGGVYKWRDQGFKHSKLPNGNIVRYFDAVRWMVEIETLGDFIDKYGACILRRESDGMLKIEIYDDYRE